MTTTITYTWSALGNPTNPPDLPDGFTVSRDWYETTAGRWRLEATNEQDDSLSTDHRYFMIDCPLPPGEYGFKL